MGPACAAALSVVQHTNKQKNQKNTHTQKKKFVGLGELLICFYKLKKPKP